MSDSVIVANTTECGTINCSGAVPQGKGTFAGHLRKLGICNACYKKRPKRVKACRHHECSKRVASGYGQTAVAARTEGFCRSHYLAWSGPTDPHPPKRSLAEIAQLVGAGFVKMDEMLATFGEEIESLDASAEVLERLVDQVRMKRDAVSDLEDALNKKATVVGRRLRNLAKKVLG